MSPFSFGFEPGSVLRPGTPDGYRRFAAAAVVGRGRADLDRLGAAVLEWRMQRAAGIRVIDARDADAPPATAGLEVRLSIRVLSALGQEWRTIAPARVGTLVEEADRRGLVYGTLPGHPERGEEAFLVRVRPDGVVLAEVVALSRPAMPYALAAPVLRRFQRDATARYLRALLPDISPRG